MNKENLCRCLWLACCKYDEYLCIFSTKVLREVIADEENFQMFQTMASLKKYKQHNFFFFFFRGLICVWTEFGPYQFAHSPNSGEILKVSFESCSFKLQYILSCHDFFSTEVPVGLGIILHFHLGKILCDFLKFFKNC